MKDKFTYKAGELSVVALNSCPDCTDCLFSTGEYTSCKKYKRKPSEIILGEIRCERRKAR